MKYVFWNLITFFFFLHKCRMCLSFQMQIGFCLDYSSHLDAITIQMHLDLSKCISILDAITSNVLK